MCVLINISVLPTGMGLGFPAVTISSLTNQTSAMALTESEISWFGKLTTTNVDIEHKRGTYTQIGVFQ